MSKLQRALLFRHLVRILVCLGAGAFFAISAYAAPTVTVIAPKAGASVGSPIFYSAYATSAACSKGIAAMRIYTADHVSAYTVDGAEKLAKACDAAGALLVLDEIQSGIGRTGAWFCLLYLSDAADDPLCVALGGRRIINKYLSSLQT